MYSFNDSLDKAVLKPAAKAPPPPREQKHIACFDCGAEFDVPTGAQSTMCKRCSRYIDLHDYAITSAVSKNFKTKGLFVIEAAGYLFNSETVAGDAVSVTSVPPPKPATTTLLKECSPFSEPV